MTQKKRSQALARAMLPGDLQMRMLVFDANARIKTDAQIASLITLADNGDLEARRTLVEIARLDLPATEPSIALSVWLHRTLGVLLSAMDEWPKGTSLDDARAAFGRTRNPRGQPSKDVDIENVLDVAGTVRVLTPIVGKTAAIAAVSSAGGGSISKIKAMCKSVENVRGWDLSAPPAMLQRVRADAKRSPRNYKKELLDFFDSPDGT